MGQNCKAQLGEMTLASPLEDLDELTLRCRDVQARTYIKEAVASYHAGAFRASIVGTWIAVCFDLMEKFRELALAGDKEAEIQVQELDVLRRTGDVTRALKFERRILEVAKEKFELISPLEFVDLERLQQDRNRCAHPSLTADEKAYSPSAELARLHLHSAVTHLLQHPPVQGKYALDLLQTEVSSEYFPTNTKGAKLALTSGPLGRPRESLVRNFVVVILKRVLKDEIAYKARSQLQSTLEAIEEMHREYYSRTMAAMASKIFRAVPDADLERPLKLILALTSTWDYLDADVRQRIQNYVCDLPIGIDDLSMILSFAPLAGSARVRLARANRDDFRRALFFELHPEIGEKIINSYLQVGSFDDANFWARELSNYAADFSPDQVRRLIVGIAKNDQITGSFQLGSLLTKFRNANVIREEEFRKLLADHDLERFIDWEDFVAELPVGE
jgi:hypothetical protein